MNKLLNRNFLTRTVSGTLFVVLVVGAVLASPWTLFGLLVVVCAGCVWEFYRIASRVGFRPQSAAGIAAAVAAVAAAFLAEAGYIDPRWLWYGLILLPAVVFVTQLYRHDKDPMGDVAATLTGIIYVGLPLALAGRMTLDGGGSELIYSPHILLAYIVLVWVNDVGAYLVGVSFGRHRLMERISPKKSWEGFWGGVALTALAGAGAGWYLEGDAIAWTVLGVVVAVSGVWGDLVESMLKRAVDLKDSGSVMPGHGGFLDRFDSLLLSLPIVYIYFELFL